MIYTELRKRVSSDNSLWNVWELRTMILCSLFLQCFLFVFGNRQGYSAKKRWLVIFVWSAYMSADWFATLSLKSLLDMKEDEKLKLMACWASFLVLHLGGSDTITAYDLQDNELWKKHLFGLVIQLCLALVVVVYWSSWSGRALTFVTIPILVAGIIRNGERILALRSASKHQIRNSILKASREEPVGGSSKATNAAERNPNHHSRKRKKDCQRTLVDSSQARSSKKATESVMQFPYEVIHDDAIYLHEAYFLYKLFRNLFADLTLKFYRETHNVLTIYSKSAKEAFELAEIELGFLYDVLHTKTTIIHSEAGMVFRFFCFLCTICSSVAFSIIIARHPNDYSKIDLVITVLLLAGAIFLDILGLYKHIYSHWMMLWLSKKSKSKLVESFCQNISAKIGKRKPEPMAQYSLIDYCLNANTSMFVEVRRHFDPYDVLVKYQNMTEINVDDELQEFIFSHLKDKYIRYGFENFDPDYIGQLLDARGDVIKVFIYKIRHMHPVPEDLDDDCKFLWSLVHGIEFDKSLLIWHIATDLNYYEDEVISNNNDIWDGVVTSLKRNVSKSLSDYMFCLLSIRPNMLPKGNGELRIRDTCEQLEQFFPCNYESENLSVNRKQVCNALLQRNDVFHPGYPEGPESCLPDAIRLAHQLRLLGENKWDMISKMWVEMLSYAASKCDWNQHAGQLKEGKELLTRVNLLMAHFFLSEQILLVESPDLENRNNVKKLYAWDRLLYLA